MLWLYELLFNNGIQRESSHCNYIIWLHMYEGDIKNIECDQSGQCTWSQCIPMWTTGIAVVRDGLVHG